jgi:hypothetical protein
MSRGCRRQPLAAIDFLRNPHGALYTFRSMDARLRENIDRLVMPPAAAVSSLANGFPAAPMRVSG